MHFQVHPGAWIRGDPHPPCHYVKTCCRLDDIIFLIPYITPGDFALHLPECAGARLASGYILIFPRAHPEKLRGKCGYDTINIIFTIVQVHQPACQPLCIFHALRACNPILFSHNHNLLSLICENSLLF